MVRLKRKSKYNGRRDNWREVNDNWPMMDSPLII